MLVLFLTRGSTDLWSKNPWGSRNTKILNFPSILLWCWLPQDKETGMPPQTAERLRTMAFPISPSTPRTPKLVGFKFDFSQIQDDWNISKRDQNFYNPWGWILQTSVCFFVWAEGFEFLSCDLGRCLFSVKDIPKLSSGKGESFLREMKGVPFLGDARSLGSCPTWLHVVGWNQHVSRLPMQCKNPGNRGNSLDSMDLKTAGCIELAELQCALKKQLEYQNLRLRRSKKDIGGLNLGKVGIFMEN